MSKQSETLYDGITRIDEQYIEQAAPGAPEPKTNRHRRKRWTLIAACLCVVVVGGSIGGVSLLRGGSSGTVDSSGNAGGTGHAEGEIYDSYAGPVFPLTILEEVSGLSAERTVTWDFSPNTSVADTGVYTPSLNVTDEYLLTNSTEEDITVTAVYPYAGTFDTPPLVLTVDGTETESELNFGNYAAGPSSDGEDSLSVGLLSLSSWEDYKALLEDGSYLEDALTPATDLTIPVTVYTFTDAQYTGSKNADAPYLNVEANVDYSQTALLTYKFNGYSYDMDTGDVSCGFFVPSENSRSADDTYYLIVLGQDLDDYTVQGYKNAGCERKDQLDGVSAAVSRQETTLDQILMELCQLHVDTLRDSLNRAIDLYYSDEVTVEMYCEQMSKAVAMYIQLGENPTQLHGPMLEDLFTEVEAQTRVLYRVFSLTIPAQSTVDVCILQAKSESYDYSCTAEDVSIRGYDLVTQLGSSLTFLSQQASISHGENIEIVRQNFGFDLDSGITTVDLDLQAEHYYLDFRWKDTEEE